MSLYKPQQRHLTVRNRELHFVSYEALPADLKHHADAQPEMWYLMRAGRRWAVMARDPDQSIEQTDAVLRQWAEANACSDEPPPVVAKPAEHRPRIKSRESWWGPGEGRQAS